MGEWPNIKKTRLLKTYLKSNSVIGFKNISIMLPDIPPGT